MLGLGGGGSTYKFTVMTEQLFTTGLPSTFTNHRGLYHFQLAPGSGSQSGLPPGLRLDADTGAVSGLVLQNTY